MNAGHVAERVHKHVFTVRDAIRAGALHGTLSAIDEPCADAWARGEQCEHRTSEATSR